MTQTTAPSRISHWIETRPQWIVVLFAMFAAFAAYLSMYAFRKPLAANSYEGIQAFSLFGTAFDYKAIALISQLLGYMCSKFLGVKFASEAPLSRRAIYVLLLILFSWLMLVLFAVTPAPYNLIWLFFNGLPLGMVWSMLFGILEGRRVTEFLGLAMSISVVFASGWVKSTGLWTIQTWGVDPFWMPAVTGLIFVPLLLLSVGMLYLLPPPNAEDIAMRTARAPMNRQDRIRFFRQFPWGVVALVGGYVCLMTYRSLRDDFMDLILSDLGYKMKASDFAQIETIVGVMVILILFGLSFFKSNRLAVVANMAIIAVGAVLTGVSTLLIHQAMISPRAFFVINGIGLYIAIVPYQSVLIDRLLASIETVATAAFLLAVADAAGYLAVVALYMTKNVYTVVTGAQINWAQLLMLSSIVISFVVPIAMAFCAVYFGRRQLSSAIQS